MSDPRLPESAAGSSGREPASLARFLSTVDPGQGNETDRVAAPAATEPEPVPERIGRFEVRERVGMGGFGSVYRAYDPRAVRGSPDYCCKHLGLTYVLAQ